MPTERDKALDAITLDGIEAKYRQGAIWASDRNALHRAKAQRTITQMLGDQGYADAVLETTLKNLQEGWDNMKEGFREGTSGLSKGSVTESPADTAGRVSGDVFQKMKAAAQTVWGQIQILGSVISAFGSVNGEVTTNWALGKGASPGLANTLGFAVDAGSGFVPIGAIFRTGVQAAGGAIRAGRMAKAGKMVEKAQQLTAEEKRAEEAAKAMDQVEEVIKQGLEMEGVVMPAAEGAAVTKAATLPEFGPANMRDVFNADLAAFKKTMAGLTEVQTHTQTQAMANRLGLTLEDLGRLVPGAALNEKEMLAYLNALDPQIKTMYTLAEAAKAGGPAEVHAFMQHMSGLLQLAPTFRGAEITAGRSVEILKESPPMKAITDLLLEMDPESIAGGNFQAAGQTLASNILAAKEAASKAAAKLALLNMQERGRTGLWAGFKTFYNNLLLAIPAGAIRDATMNTFTIATNLMETQIAGIFSASKEGVELGAAWYKIKGMNLALGEAFKNVAKTFTTRGELQIAGSSIFDSHYAATLGGPVGTAVQTPALARMAADNWFKTIIRAGSIYEQAMRDGHLLAKQHGWTKEQLGKFVANRRLNPTETMNEVADQEALYLTFQNELGKMGEWMRKGMQFGPLALLFPFVKNPINVKKYAWNRTPGLQLLSGQFWDEVAAGGVKADMAIGRVTWATMQGMFLYQMAQEGYITGSGPVGNPALYQVWKMTHEPYSVKTPFGWLPLTPFDPAITTIGMISDFAQVHNRLPDPTAEQTAFALMFSISRDMTQSTWWPTIDKLVDVMHGNLKGVPAGVRSFEALANPALTTLAGPVAAAASLATGGPKEALLGATGGPVAQRLRTITDPIKRDTRTFIEDALNMTPGYSKTLNPDRDPLGDPILLPQAIGSPWLNLAIPLTIRPQTEDSRKQLLNQLKVEMPKWADRVGLGTTTTPGTFGIQEPQPGEPMSADLTTQEINRRWQIFRQILKHPKDGLEAQVLNDPNFLTSPSTGEKTPPVAQKHMIEQYLHSARQQANEMLISESQSTPSLYERILRSQYSKQAPMMGPQEQATEQKSLGLDIQLWEKTTPMERENLMRWGLTPGEGTP